MSAYPRPLKRRIPAPVESRKMLLNEPEDSDIRVTHGDTLCPRATTFDDFVPSTELLKGLTVEMNFQKPSKIQAISMPMILTPPYRDLIVQADEGSGKTTCAVLGMLSRVDPTLQAPQALCICPTRDSALRVLDVLQKIAMYTGIKSEAAVTKFPRGLTSLSDRPPFTAQVVVGECFTVDSFMYLKKLCVEHLKVLVFHEAHHMLAQESLKKFFLRFTWRIDRVNTDRQVLLFTETFNDAVESFMTGISKAYNQLLVNEEELPLESANLYRVNCPVELAKVLVIKRMILDSLEGLVPITIFVGTKDRASLLHTVLHKSGHKVTNIQASHSRDRDKVLKDFKDGSIPVLISTLPLPRGFDLQKVNVVINYDLPMKHADPNEPDYEVFLQRTARTGRCGHKRAVFNLLGTKKDRALMENIENHFGTLFAPVVRWDSVQEFKAALRSAGVVGTPTSVLELLPLSTALMMWDFKADVITDFAASRVTKRTAAAAAPDRKKITKTLKEPKDSDIVTGGRWPHSDARTFEYFYLSEELLRGLRDEMKFQKPSKIQRRSFPMIRYGPPYRDFIARAPDGSGKTTCSVIAVLDRVDPLLEALQALYVCPTEELAIQTMEVVQKMGKYTRISSETAVAMDCSENLLSLKEQTVTAQVVIGTPRTINERMSMFLSGSSIKILVFDGADRLYAEDRSMNASLNIRKEVKQVHPDCQVLLFSEVIKEATLMKKVLSGVEEECDQVHVTEEEPAPELVRHFKVNCPDELAMVLTVKDRFLESKEKLGAALISAGTRDAKSVLRNVLYDLGVGANVLWPEDGEEEDMADELVDDQSLSAEQEKVNCVVNWKPPVTHEDPNEPDYEAYFRRVDSVRCFGRRAVFNLLFTEEDRAVMEKIESRLEGPTVEVAPWDSVEAFNKAIGSLDPPAGRREFRMC